MVQKINNRVAINDTKGYKIEISERNEIFYSQGLAKINFL